MANLFSPRGPETSVQLHLCLGPRVAPPALPGAPRRRAAAQDAPGLITATATAASSTTASCSPTSIRVLLADSRPMVLRGLTELINARKPRMEVVAVASGYARLLALSQLLRPEVVLFSFFRDAMDGLEALAALIQRCNPRVLLLKNQDDSAPITRGMELGAHGVVLAEDPTDSIAQAIVAASQATPRAEQSWLGGMGRLAAATPSRTQPVAPPSAQARLTVRERELIAVIVENPAAKYLAIGAMLGISEHTVHNHLTSIYHKLGLVNRIELLVYALTHVVGGAPPADDPPG